jgi:hypothetical protein
LLLGERPVQHREQLANIELEPARAELKGLTTHQPGQAGWQLVRPWQPRALNQDRDDPNVALKSSFDLEAHKIIWICEPASPILVSDRQPLITDERQQHVAGPDRVGDDLGEVITRDD